MAGEGKHQLHGVLRGRAGVWALRLRMYGANCRRLPARALDALDRSIWVVGSVLFAVAARLSPWGLPNDWILTSYSAVWIFAAFAATSVALLALQSAVSIFRGQQLASRLPPVLVGDLFQPREHRASSWRLVTVLVMSLWTLGPIDQGKLPSTAATIAVIDALLLLVSIASITRSTQRVFDPDYSRVAASLIVRRLDDDYLGEQHGRAIFPPPSLAAGVETDRPEPFALIEQICVRAMTENDPTTVRLVLRRVSGRVLGYLNGREFAARGVLAWLGEVLAAVGGRALVLDERTAVLVMLLFQDVMMWSLERHLRWSERIELLRFFRELRHAAIREAKTTVVNEGLYVLSRTFESALKTAPSEDRIWLLHVREPNPPPDNVDIDLEWQHLYENWVWELGMDMELMSTKGLEDSFGTGQFVYGRMMDDVLASENLGPRQKRFLIQQIVGGSARAVREALRKGGGEGYVRWAFEFRFKTLDEQGLQDLVIPALEEWQRIVTAAATAGKLSWMALNEFAAAGRGFAREGRDDRAALIARTLGKVATTLRGHAADEVQAGYDHAVDALRSLSEFDQRAASELKTAVNAELTALREVPEGGAAPATGDP